MRGFDVGGVLRRFDAPGLGISGGLSDVVGEVARLGPVEDGGWLHLRLEIALRQRGLEAHPAPEGVGLVFAVDGAKQQVGQVVAMLGARRLKMAGARMGDHVVGGEVTGELGHVGQTDAQQAAILQVKNRDLPPGAILGLPVPRPRHVGFAVLVAVNAQKIAPGV